MFSPPDSSTIYIQFWQQSPSIPPPNTQPDKQYLQYFQKLSLHINTNFPNLKVLGNQIPPHWIPSQPGHYYNKYTKQYLTYPRSNSFQIVFRGYQLHSKKKYINWPNLSDIVNKIQSVLLLSDCYYYRQLTLPKYTSLESQYSSNQSNHGENSSERKTLTYLTNNQYDQQDKRITFYQKNQIKKFSLTDHFQFYQLKKQQHKKIVKQLKKKQKSQPTLKIIKLQSQNTKNTPIRQQNTSIANNLPNQHNQKTHLPEDKTSKQIIINLDRIEQQMFTDQNGTKRQTKLQKSKSKQAMRIWNQQLNLLQQKCHHVEQTLNKFKQQNLQFDNSSQSFSAQWLEKTTKTHFLNKPQQPKMLPCPTIPYQQLPQPKPFEHLSRVLDPTNTYLSPKLQQINKYIRSSTAYKNKRLNQIYGDGDQPFLKKNLCTQSRYLQPKKIYISPSDSDNSTQKLKNTNKNKNKVLLPDLQKLATHQNFQRKINVFKDLSKQPQPSSKQNANYFIRMTDKNNHYTPQISRPYHKKQKSSQPPSRSQQHPKQAHPTKNQKTSTPLQSKKKQKFLSNLVQFNHNFSKLFYHKKQPSPHSNQPAQQQIYSKTTSRLNNNKPSNYLFNNHPSTAKKPSTTNQLQAKTISLNSKQNHIKSHNKQIKQNNQSPHYPRQGKKNNFNNIQQKFKQQNKPSNTSNIQQKNSHIKTQHIERISHFTLSIQPSQHNQKSTLQKLANKTSIKRVQSQDKTTLQKSINTRSIKPQNPTNFIKKPPQKQPQSKQKTKLQISKQTSFTRKQFKKKSDHIELKQHQIGQDDVQQANYQDLQQYHQLKSKNSQSQNPRITIKQNTKKTTQRNNKQKQNYHTNSYTKNATNNKQQKQNQNQINVNKSKSISKNNQKYQHNQQLQNISQNLNVQQQHPSFTKQQKNNQEYQQLRQNSQRIKEKHLTNVVQSQQMNQNTHGKGKTKHECQKSILQTQQINETYDEKQLNNLSETEKNKQIEKENQRLGKKGNKSRKQLKKMEDSNTGKQMKNNETDQQQKQSQQNNKVGGVASEQIKMNKNLKSERSKEKQEKQEKQAKQDETNEKSNQNKKKSSSSNTKIRLVQDGESHIYPVTINTKHQDSFSQKNIPSTINQIGQSAITFTDHQIQPTSKKQLIKAKQNKQQSQQKPHISNPHNQQNQTITPQHQQKQIKQKIFLPSQNQQQKNSQQSSSNEQTQLIHYSRQQKQKNEQEAMKQTVGILKSDQLLTSIQQKKENISQCYKQISSNKVYHEQNQIKAQQSKVKNQQLKQLSSIKHGAQVANKQPNQTNQQQPNNQNQNQGSISKQNYINKTNEQIDKNPQGKIIHLQLKQIKQNAKDFIIQQTKQTARQSDNEIRSGCLQPPFISQKDQLTQNLGNDRNIPKKETTKKISLQKQVADNKNTQFLETKHQHHQLQHHLITQNFQQPQNTKPEQHFNKFPQDIQQQLLKQSQNHQQKQKKYNEIQSTKLLSKQSLKQPKKCSNKNIKIINWQNHSHQILIKQLQQNNQLNQNSLQTTEKKDQVKINPIPITNQVTNKKTPNQQTKLLNECKQQETIVQMVQIGIQKYDTSQIGFQISPQHFVQQFCPQHITYKKNTITAQKKQASTQNDPQKHKQKVNKYPPQNQQKLSSQHHPSNIQQNLNQQQIKQLQLVNINKSQSKSQNISQSKLTTHPKERNIGRTKANSSLRINSNQYHQQNVKQCDQMNDTVQDHQQSLIIKDSNILRIPLQKPAKREQKKKINEGNIPRQTFDDHIQMLPIPSTFNTQHDQKASQVSPKKQPKQKIKRQLKIQRALITKQLYGAENDIEKEKFQNKSQFFVDFTPSYQQKFTNWSSATDLFPDAPLFSRNDIGCTTLIKNASYSSSLQKALAILGYLNEYLIIRLFQNKDQPTSSDGLYGIWLCDHYIWKCFIINGNIPLDQNQQPLGLTFKQPLQKQLWLYLLQKALALCLGGYQQLQCVDTYKILHILTGSNILSYKVREDPQKNNKLFLAIKNCANKNFFMNCEKSQSNIRNFQDRKIVSIYRVGNAKIINIEQKVLQVSQIKQGRQNKFWMKLDKFSQQFQSIQMLQLRMNHNICRLSLQNSKGILSITRLSFQTQTLGTITISNKYKSGQIKIYLYRQQSNNILKLIGQAKDKCKNHLFFDCCFAEGQYFVFVQMQFNGGTITYTGQGHPHMQFIQQIRANGYKNNYTQYLPISKHFIIQTPHKNLQQPFNQSAFIQKKIKKNYHSAIRPKSKLKQVKHQTYEQFREIFANFLLESQNKDQSNLK